MEEMSINAENGDVYSQAVLGTRHREGEGCEADFSEALIWLRRAAENGHPPAQEALSLAFLYGLGVTEDADSALIWMERSGNQGYPKAMLNPGISYYHGLCGKVDYTKSRSWYERLAETDTDGETSRYVARIFICQSVQPGVRLCVSTADG